MLAYLFVVLAIGLRFLPFPLPAVAPALLFFGARGPRKQAWIPLTMFALADVALTRFVYHYPLTIDTVVTWAWYAGILLFGMLLRKHMGALQVLGSSLLAAISFFVISNFAVWAAWDMYPKTAAGLMESYTMGLPFFRRDVVGDLLFAGVFFGVAALIKAIRPAEVKATA